MARLDLPDPLRDEDVNSEPAGERRMKLREDMPVKCKEPNCSETVCMEDYTYPVCIDCFSDPQWRCGT